jgi:hypothetical protein
MRAVALRRKNYRFVGSEAGGKAAAIAYTLIETAKLDAVDPHVMLADSFTCIPDYRITRVDDLLPWRWSRARSGRTLTNCCSDRIIALLPQPRPGHPRTLTSAGRAPGVTARLRLGKTLLGF